MSEHRTFSVCQGCGAWKETGSDVQSLWVDYDMMFFIKHHGIRCPVTGQPSALMYSSDGDPDFHPLALEKQWTPESCPDYRPSQIPKFTRYMNDIEEWLAGLWHTNNVGGHSDETLVLWPDGRAAIDFYNIDFCGRDCFRWRLDGHEHICFEGLDTYFRSGRVYF
jgi:hypothetical protein